MANNSRKAIEENLEETTFESLVSIEKVMRIEDVLAEYPDLLLNYKERKNPEVYPSVLILETYKFEKPLTSIEVDDTESKRTQQLIEDLKEFFFVTFDHHQIHVSRFRTLSRMAIGKFEEDGKKVELSDRNADYAGLFYGKSLKQIVEYCLKRGLYHLIK